MVMLDDNDDDGDGSSLFWMTKGDGELRGDSLSHATSPHDDVFHIFTVGLPRHYDGKLLC